MKLIISFVITLLTLAIFGTPQTSHALSVRRDFYNKCTANEVEKGTSPDKAAEFCCDLAGGKIFIDVYPDGLEIYECVFPNEFDDDQVEVINDSDLHHFDTSEGTIQKIKPQPRAFWGTHFSR